jgi:hypothetical protein
MATAITVNCPECDKKMKVPEDARGKKVRCKACEHVFVVPGGAAKPPDKAKPAKPASKPTKPGAADDDGDGKPYGVTTLDLTPRCPDCANEMEEGDRICLHCGYDTRTRTFYRTRKLHDTTGADVFLWLLPGIACVIAVLGLIGLDIYYCTGFKSLVEGDDFWWWLGWGGCQMWFVIGSLFLIYMAGKFAVKRLILNNKPPEVEKN